MSHTTLEGLSGHDIEHTEVRHRSLKNKKLKLDLKVSAEQKRKIRSKLNAIGEEILCWLFIGAMITLVTLLFSSLH